MPDLSNKIPSIWSWKKFYLRVPSTRSTCGRVATGHNHSETPPAPWLNMVLGPPSRCSRTFEWIKMSVKRTCICVSAFNVTHIFLVQTLQNSKPPLRALLIPFNTDFSGIHSEATHPIWWLLVRLLLSSLWRKVSVCCEFCYPVKQSQIEASSWVTFIGKGFCPVRVLWCGTCFSAFTDFLLECSVMLREGWATAFLTVCLHRVSLYNSVWVLPCLSRTSYKGRFSHKNHSCAVPLV